MTLVTCDTCRGMGQWCGVPVCPDCNGTGDVWAEPPLVPLVHTIACDEIDWAGFVALPDADAPHVGDRAGGFFLVGWPPEAKEEFLRGLAAAADAPHVVEEGR